MTALLEASASRVEHPEAFARDNRVLLLRDRNGVPIDVVLGALPFEERAARRASAYAFDDDVALPVEGCDWQAPDLCGGGQKSNSAAGLVGSTGIEPVTSAV